MTTPKSSKFSSVIAAHRGDPEPEPAASDRQANPPGRPDNGKRSDPEYAQVSAWVRKYTHRQVKIKPLTKADERDFSELVQSLLEAWIETP